MFLRWLLRIGVCGWMCAVVWAEDFTVESCDLKLQFRVVEVSDGQKILIDSLTDKETGTEFLQPEKSYFFTLLVQDTSTRALHYLNSQTSWKQISVQQKNDGTTIRLEHPAGIEHAETLWVVVRVAADSTKRGMDFSLTGQPETNAYSYRQGSVALWWLRKWGDSLRFLYSKNCGCVAEKPMETDFLWSARYPGGIVCTMGLMALWDDATRQGLYASSHDPTGSIKTFTFNGRDADVGPNTAKLAVEYAFAGMGEPGNGVTAPGTFHLEALRGDWFDAAQIYRNWMTHHARWMPPMGPEGRTDIPLWLKEQCAWVMASSDDRWLTVTRFTYTPLDKMGDALRAYQQAVGVPIAVHWYLWHEGPYDNDFPHFFPAKEGFREAVADIQKAGDIRVMPYTNGHLWDTHDRGIEDWQYTTHGKPNAVQNEDGSIFTESHTGKEDDGSFSVLAAMCPATQVWQDQVRRNTLTAMNQHNTAAVYIDQVAACLSYPCFNRNHPHPVGAGSWWVDSYREMMKRIRTDMRREVADIPLTPELREQLQTNPNLLQERVVTTECNAEPYVDQFDALLVWHWNEPHQVPAFSAVYGGLIPMFGRAYRGDEFSFVTRVGQSLAFGEQIGWFDPSTRNRSDIFPYIRDAIRFRWQIRDFFYQGEMARPPRWKSEEGCSEMPQVTSVWPFWSDQQVTLDAVQAAVWRKRQDSSVVVYFSNVSEKPVTATPILDWEELGLSGKNVQVFQVDSEGITPTQKTLSDLEKPLTFPPRHSWGFLLKPVKE